LPNGDNESGKVAAYLTRIENRLEAWINANYFYNVTQFWETLNNNQKEQYKYALLEQAYYVLRMGDISVDSGYDKERGIIAGRSTINELSVAPKCYASFRKRWFLKHSHCQAWWLLSRWRSEVTSSRLVVVSVKKANRAKMA